MRAPRYFRLVPTGHLFARGNAKTPMRQIQDTFWSAVERGRGVLQGGFSENLQFS